MPKLFGTDGVRGVANADLTPDLALALGRATGATLLPEGGTVVVGRDTRVSGPMLEDAFVAGLCSAGANVALAGILPTPGIAYLITHEKAAAGAVISASHNPVQDNGIKVFGDDGYKIDPDREAEIEDAMVDPPSDLPVGEDVGVPHEIEDATETYVTHLLSTGDEPLTGLRIVLDCAFGATYDAGPRAFRAAGCDLIELHAEPDGTRINVDCGSTDLTTLSKAVVAEGAHLGLAFDGDGDRVLAVDETGQPVDGDMIIAMLADDLHQRGELAHDVVVSTVMANLGFRRALEERGIEVVAVPVGDKYVAEAMVERGAAIGGEQSGHVILAKHATTGDGILTGLHLAQMLHRSGDPLSKLAHQFEPYPQVLINIPVGDKQDLDNAESLWDEVHRAEAALGDSGRILVRASGTEPVVRVMVEAADETSARETAEHLAESVVAAIGSSPS
jgi:phosphoglucosamine mutase